jgi:hypothetical protein
MQKHSIYRPPVRPRIETTVIYPSSASPQQSNRTVYLLETPKSPNFRLDIPITNGISLLTSEQYEYDMIESPQTFLTDFHVDWRTFNLVLWSKCYCRYDQINYPSAKEQDLSNEINSLKEDLEKIRSRSKRSITLDTYHCVCHHPHTHTPIKIFYFRLVMRIHGIHKRWILVYNVQYKHNMICFFLFFCLS